LHSKSSTTITLLSLAGNQADINIDGWIYIGPWIEKSEWHLTEKNIIMWKKTKVNVVPILDVHSNDIKASHGASIDKLSEEDLFYLRAKWLTREKSSHLMIQGHIDAILSHFSHDGNLNEIASVKRKIMEYIL
jgi:Fe-S cluster assembly protein SufD